jgi:hypothetical protein
VKLVSFLASKSSSEVCRLFLGKHSYLVVGMRKRRRKIRFKERFYKMAEVH